MHSASITDEKLALLINDKIHLHDTFLTIFIEPIHLYNAKWTMQMMKLLLRAAIPNPNRGEKFKYSV
jgi:hypothetical protein